MVAYRQAWLVLVVCKLALSSLVGYMPALSEEEAVECMMEPACLQRKSALAERAPWLVVGCAPRGSEARCPTGRSGPAARGAAGARTLLRGAPSTSLRNLRWNKTAEKCQVKCWLDNNGAGLTSGGGGKWMIGGFSPE